MNRKTGTVVLGVSLAAVLAVSSVLYSRLSAHQSVPSAAASAASQSAGESVSPAGNAAPDFTVYDASGKTVKLSDFRGKPVVLNFWASWCGYCKQEMPEFNQAYRKYGGSVQFLFIDWTDGQQETQQKASAYLKSQGYSFPAYYDLDQSAVAQYGLTGIPATFFITRQGRLAQGVGGIGLTTADSLEEGIRAILQ